MANPGELTTFVFGTATATGVLSVSGYGVEVPAVKKGGIEDTEQAYRPGGKVDRKPVKLEIEGEAGAWITLCEAKGTDVLTITTLDEDSANGEVFTCSAFISAVEVSGLEQDANQKATITFQPVGVVSNPSAQSVSMSTVR
jgi:hypothetical protein